MQLRNIGIPLFCLVLHTSTAQDFHVSKTYKIGSPGGWDYIAVGPDHKLYVSHGTQVNILDQRTGDSVGVIPNTAGVHGIAFASGKGYTSNGRANTVTVFDGKTAAVLQQIPVGQNPDAIMYEPFSKTIVTCNGRSHDLSVVDPASNTVTATIPLDGKPETAVSDENGRIYINIEDKNKITVVDMRTKKVLSSWPLDAEGPTGLAIDNTTHRLFAGCDKQLVILDANSGAVVSKQPIGDGCDGVGFDETMHLIFASCGEGKLSVIKEESATSFKPQADVPTKRSARTLAVDSKTHEIYLPAADTEKPNAGERPRTIPGTFQVLVVTKG